MSAENSDLEQNVARIEQAALKAAAGFRSMAPSLLSLRNKRPDLTDRLLSPLRDVQSAIEVLIQIVSPEPRA